MGKNKLHIDYDFNFLLLALNANVKPHKLAWSMNRELKLELTKQPNIQLEFKSSKRLSIANYLFEEDHRKVRLLMNRAVETDDSLQAFILPELKNFDYFIVLENESNTFDESTFINKTKEIPFVQFALLVDLTTLKSRDNLIF